jgi:hypothetical protein
MMHRLLSISLSLVLFFSCSPGRQLSGQLTPPKSYVSEAADGLIYKASFSYKEYNFSGLMVIKPEGDDIRIALLSELGPTIMSFRLTPETMEVLDMVDILKKKLVLKQLEYDLRLMSLAGLHQNEKVRFKKKIDGQNKYKLGGKKHMIVYSIENGNVILAKRKGIGFDRATVEFNFEEGGSAPSRIVMEHSLVDLNLKLDFIE